jgi:hypothetical protein
MSDILSKVVAGYLGEDITSDSDYHAFPQVLHEQISLYPNERALLLNWMRMTGRTGVVKGRELKVYYDGALVRTAIVGTGGLGTSAAKAPVTFILDSDCYDTSGNCVLQNDETVMIPPQFLTKDDDGAYYKMSKPFFVRSHDATAAPRTVWTLYPLGNYGILTQLPAGTELQISANTYPEGGGQPKRSEEHTSELQSR